MGGEHRHQARLELFEALSHVVAVDGLVELSAVAAEMNRHAYTGYGAAGMNWLETVWPGNDTVKVTFLDKLRESRAKSVFADELRLLATDTR